MQIRNLLITSIGGDIAQSTANIITKNRPDIRLIGTDIETRHAGSLFVDIFLQIPVADHPDYLINIGKIIKKFDIDTLLPISEQELAIFLAIDNKIGDCQILHCGNKSLEVGLDKLKTNQLLQSINAPYPWTILASDASSVDMPCILKPRTGSGSKGIHLIENQTDFEYFKHKYPNYIFQELLKPSNQEITCAVYRTRSGDTYVLQMLRRLIGGTTGWAIIVEHQEITALCIKIANSLEVFGSINIQLINTNKGAYIFEINPRISSTATMRDSIGFKDVIWLIDELESKTISKPTVIKNKTLVKICSIGSI